MIILPNKVDKTPEGIIVKKADIGEKGYAENIEYSLRIHPTDKGFVIIDYYGEDESYLAKNEIDEILNKTMELI